MVEIAGKAAIDATHSMSHEQEVYDAEIVGIPNKVQKCSLIC